MNARLSLFVLIAALAACSSTETRQNREASAKFERELRIGLTPEEVSKLSGAKMGNCEGSPRGYQRCSAIFWVGTDGDISSGLNPATIPLSLPSGSYNRDHYRDIVLHFSQGKLERWEEAESARFRTNTSPGPR